MADQLPPTGDNITDRAKKVDELGSDGFIVALAGAIAFPVALVLSSALIRYTDTNWVLTYTVICSFLPTIAMFGTSLVRRGGLRGMRLSRAIKLLRREQQRVLWKLEQGRNHSVYTTRQLEKIKEEFRQITRQIDHLSTQLNRRLTDTDDLLPTRDEVEEDALELTSLDDERLSGFFEQIRRELESRRKRPDQ